MAPAAPRARRGARQALIGAVVAVVVALGVLAVLSQRSPSGLPPEGPRAGALAPGFSLTNLRAGGPPVTLGRPDGRPTVVTFFASWCPHCRADIRVLAAASHRMGATVRFVGVDVADSPSAMLALVHAAGLDYPIGSDPSRRVSGALYRLVGLPSAVFVNGTGHVVGHVLGAISASELTAWVRRAQA